MHIDKIIDTYRNRTEEDKYSKRIFIHTDVAKELTDVAVQRLNDIKSNDYNLNIPRYVDTFEAEDIIDINAIANDIKVLDTKITDTDKTIADFCKQLNIVTPF